MNIDFVKHKRRLDMGRFYMGYYQMIGTALILMGVFKLTQWYWFVAIPTVVVIICYAMGTVHERYVYSKEQNMYSKQNPFMMEIKQELHTIKKQLDEIQGSKD